MQATCPFPTHLPWELQANVNANAFQHLIVTGRHSTCSLFCWFVGADLALLSSRTGDHSLQRA